MSIFRLAEKISVAVILVLCFALIAPVHATASTLSFGNMKSVDVMKYTKDVLKSQPSDADIQSLVTTLKTLNVNYIAMSVPMDDTASYPSDSKPAPRTAEAFTQKWADTIHNAGLHIIWRGTFSGIEGIYNFPKRVGGNRFPAGTASSAASDGGNSWLGKIYQYVTKHPSYFAAGDIWAPLPERTEGIFSDSTSFLSNGGAGIKENYATFFNDLKKVSDNAFATIGKNVITGLTTNNYTEIASTWLNQSVFDTASYTVVDYYGSSHTPSEMESNLRAIYALHGKPVMVQEWGDYWNSSMSQSARTAYLQSIYSVLQKLVNEGKVIGFNYWGGWEGPGEGIVNHDSSGFHLNYAGELLKNFFTGNTAVAATTPAPIVIPPVVTPPVVLPTTGTQAAQTSGTASVTCPQPATNAFTGCYYSDQTLGNLVLARTDNTINFVWDNTSPDAKVPSTHFSARWQGKFTFNAGSYTFTTATDDGTRLYIDGQPLIDEWHGQSTYPAHTVTKTLTAGTHLITLEYYQATGGSVAILKWAENQGAQVAQPVAASSGFTGSYYKGMNFSELAFTRNDPVISFGWNGVGPDPSLPADLFSVKWAGDFNFTAGNHTFTMNSDDGARLYIDDALVIDDWKGHMLDSKTFTKNLSAGSHNIRMEYYQEKGGSVAKLNWD